MNDKVAHFCVGIIIGGVGSLIISPLIGFILV